MSSEHPSNAEENTPSVLDLTSDSGTVLLLGHSRYSAIRSERNVIWASNGNNRRGRAQSHSKQNARNKQDWTPKYIPFGVLEPSFAREDEKTGFHGYTLSDCDIDATSCLYVPTESMPQPTTSACKHGHTQARKQRSCLDTFPIFGQSTASTR
jgi:hypothetical protein